MRWHRANGAKSSREDALPQKPFRPFWTTLAERVEAFDRYPDVEIDIAVGHRFDVEPDRRNCGDRLVQFEFVKDGCFGK